MRISKADVAIREQFVKEFFRKFGADTTVAEANNEVKVKFGKMMRAVRMYELRAEVAAEEAKAEATPAAVEAPAAVSDSTTDKFASNGPQPVAEPAQRTTISDADAELAALLSELVVEE